MVQGARTGYSDDEREWPENQATTYERGDTVGDDNDHNYRNVVTKVIEAFMFLIMGLLGVFVCFMIIPTAFDYVSGNYEWAASIKSGGLSIAASIVSSLCWLVSMVILFDK